MVKWINYDCELINPLPYENAIKHLELCGRNCYNSYNKITDDSCYKFVSDLIKNGHTSVLEHITVTAKVIMDRGLSHEWVRHRVGSAYSQQSTRYCKFEEPECIMPTEINNMEENNPIKISYLHAVNESCNAYTELIKKGIAPQIARGVLPTCLATILYATHNFREWREIFRQRLLDNGAHPDIRVLMKIVFTKLYNQYPVIFEDLKVKANESGLSI